MQHPLAGLPTDSTGATILGNQTQGCRHCGTIEAHYSTNGRIVWYHPGTQCCLNALNDQLRWREEELQALRREITDHQKRIDAMHAQLDQATGQEKAVINNEITKQTKALENKIKTNSIKAKGDPSKHITGIQQEIDQLNHTIKNWAR